MPISGQMVFRLSGLFLWVILSIFFPMIPGQMPIRFYLLPVLLITVALFISQRANSQNFHRVIGTVWDSAGGALQGAQVRLAIKNSSDTISTITTAKGEFLFTHVPSLSFTIIIEASGYEKHTRKVEQNNSGNTRLDPFILTPAVKTLEEVVLKTPAITIKQDTLEFKADSFLSRKDALLEDLLRRIPGMQVSRDGTLTIYGQPINRLKLDGKDFFSNDMLTALKELPANIIDKVQVIDDYGTMAAVSGVKSGTPLKTLNLKLKKDKKNGVFGKLSLGAGTGSRYQGSASTSILSPKNQWSFALRSGNTNNNSFASRGNGMNPIGLTAVNSRDLYSQPNGDMKNDNAGINWRMDIGEKNSISGNYNYNQRKVEGSRELTQQLFYPSEKFIVRQSDAFYNKGKGHNVNLNLDWYPGIRSFLQVMTNFAIDNNNQRKQGNFDYQKEPNIRTSSGNSRDSIRSISPSAGLSILFSQGFMRKGRNLSLQASWGSSSSDNRKLSSLFSRNYLVTPYHDSLLNQSLFTENNYDDLYLQLIYNEPVSKHYFIDLTGDYSSGKNRTARKNYWLLPGKDSLVKDPADDFSSKNYSASAGLQVRGVFKKFNYTAGFTVMPQQNNNEALNSNTGYPSLHLVSYAPQAKFNFQFFKNANFSLGYNGRSRLPQPGQLSPARDITDPLNQKEGNPSLKAEFAHSFQISLNAANPVKGTMLVVGMNVTTVQHKITTNTIALGNSGALLTRPENINGFYSGSFFYNYSKPWHRNKFLINLNGSAVYQHNVFLANGGRSLGANWYVYQGIRFRYAIKNLEWEAMAGYRQLLNKNELANSSFQNSSWDLSSSLRLELPWQIVFNAELESIYNTGISSYGNAGNQLLNLSAEKKIFSKVNIYFGLSAFNILDQNISLVRTISANSITDIRSYFLNRYCLATFSWRWNRFGSQQAK